MGICLAGQNVFFQYGKLGHFAKDYLVTSQPLASKPQHQGWAFALSGEVATESEDLIEGKCEVDSTILTVLYDSSATYSFILHDYVHRLGLPISKLPHDLEESIPTKK